MLGTKASPATGKSLQDPRLKEHLQRLRQTDNVTNLYYLIRTYLFLAAVIGGTIWFYHYRAEADWAWAWNVPVTLVAIVLVGAGQHQLTGLSHEAAHHILFRNRRFNELASDLLTMFPMFSSTYHYRLQHLAHHQFVNDPVRDPDVSQLQTSGHWLKFPLARAQFLWTLLKQLWVPNLVKYVRIRARYNSIPTGNNPYLKKGWKPRKAAVLFGLVYLVCLIGMLFGLFWLGDPLWLAAAPAAWWAMAMVFYCVIPHSWYHQSRVHPVVSLRTMTLLRISYYTALFTGLTWIQFLTGEWAAGYFLLLWLLPILTSFSFFMVLRQIVQHGNGGRGWLTNTRVFLVHPFISFSVFPLGQEYHLPHHLFASVPHYRLRELHEVLMSFPEYREQAVVVEGYFVPKHRPPTNPTVLDVLGPEYAPRTAEIYIDDTVLEDDQVEEKAAILQEGKMAQNAGA
jgi:fatty acid desaturase